MSYELQLEKIITSNPPFISGLKPSEWAEQHRIMTSDVSAFPGKFSYDRTPYLKEPVDCLSPDHPSRVIAVMKGAQIGFALDVNEQIPTPNGMVKMLDIKVGDLVYDENGNPTEVIKATDVMHNHKCYKVTFTDGTEVIADAEHLWTVYDLKNVKRTINTEKISKSVKRIPKNPLMRSRNRYYVKNANPVYNNHCRNLPIDPYLLGLWLGDGHTNGNRITCEFKDGLFYQSQLSEVGIETELVETDTHATLRVVDAFNSWKGGSNLYGNKHIPEDYFNSSISQRMSLLQGLIDTDGHVMKDGKVEFYNINKELILQVKRLISSLGYKVTIRLRENKDTYTTIHPERRYKMKPLYVLNFMGNSETPPARLPRKKNRLRSIKDIRSEVSKRWICKVEEADSVPVKCITVNNPSNLFLCTESYIPTHNSTGVIENGIGWIIANNPGNILLAARDETLVKKMMETKIDQMIDSTGIRELIRPNVIRKRNQRTGDTSLSKEFPGGNLSAFSIQKPGRMRQISAKYGFLDDFEAAPVDKDAGDAGSLFETRFASYFSSMKLFYISTPETKQTSNIEPIYDYGDCRKYHVPCPCCGDYIELQWDTKTDDGKKAGIIWETDKEGTVIEDSVFYRCQSCGDTFDDSRKAELLLNGKWIPTKKPVEKGFYSYHISALYAPPGMYNWTHYAREFVKACPQNEPVNIEKYKTFINTCLGETWEAQGEKPKAKGISLNTRDYSIGVIPVQQSRDDGNGEIVLITLGSDMNGKEDDARLDYEIVAWSETGTSYSIKHGSIGTFIPRENTLKVKKDRERWSYHHGAKNSVWPEFQRIISEELPTDIGTTMKVSVTGLDTGYFTQLAYSFLDKCEGLIFGLKGKDADKFRKLDADSPPFKIGRERDRLFLVEVNQVKDTLASEMKLRWTEGDGEQPIGFMNFPEPSEGLYNNKSFFNHFESEHRIVDSKAKGTSGMRWVKVKQTAQNHMWDCRVYNIALKEILTFLLCKESKVTPSWSNYVELINSE